MGTFTPRFETKIRLHGKAESLARERHKWINGSKTIHTQYLAIGIVDDAGRHITVIDKNVDRLQTYVGTTGITVNLIAEFSDYYGAGRCDARILVDEVVRDNP